MARNKTLTELRRDIDAVDQKLLALIAKRARLALDVGRAKRRGARAVLDAARERRVIAAVRDANPGPLRDDTIESIFREIISACRASQQPTSVAFFGPDGTFTHEAAVKQFGRSADFLAAATIEEVFRAVEAGRAAFGVVPIENTTEGAVTPTLDALAETTASVVSEVSVKVDQCLMAASNDPAAVRRITSHPQALAQCRRYLAEHFPKAEQIPAASTTAAAALAKKRRGTAAVGSRLAAALYDLQIVARAIQDNPANVTRFMVLGMPTSTPATGRDRTSLVVSVKDEVGILERVIRPFSRHEVNLSMIESRPLHGRPWEYRFFIDVTGHRDDENVGKAIAAVERIALAVKILGSYPVGD